MLLNQKADSLKDMTIRIKYDFCLTGKEVEQQLSESIGEYTPEDLQRWELSNWLEGRVIDGEKRYFRRAVPNLKRMIDHREGKGKGSPGYLPRPFDLFKSAMAEQVITASADGSEPVEPVRMKIRYTLTVKADAVPAGETIRCWLPFPREDHPRQKEVTLLSASPGSPVLSPAASPHRTLYLEQTAVAGVPAIFEASFSFTGLAQYFDLTHIQEGTLVSKDTSLLRYTVEETPHIVFTTPIRQLSDSLTGQETRPVRIARTLFDWIDTHIPWAGALEYGIIPNIPEYVLTNRRGDCGMKTLLFMTLARYNGIPARWQSGWMMHPGEVNLHDWCEIWLEETGWVPVDMSFGTLLSDDSRVQYFYLSGMDPYRLIVNNAIAGPLMPPKKYLRSEPYDFQRGEVEWKNGNLYFDKWTYQMEVEY